jgi:hypothetical protein
MVWLGWGMGIINEESILRYVSWCVGPADKGLDLFLLPLYNARPPTLPLLPVNTSPCSLFNTFSYSHDLSFHNPKVYLYCILDKVWF